MFWGQNVPSLKYAQFWNKLVSETCAIALVQADTQVNQFASGTDRAGNITNFTENRAGKVFSSRLKRNLFFNFCVCHKKGESWMEQSVLLLLCILLLLLHSITICKIRVIYCKVLKVFNFKLVSSFLSFKILFWAKTSSDTRLIP